MAVEQKPGASVGRHIDKALQRTCITGELPQRLLRQLRRGYVPGLA